MARRQIAIVFALAFVLRALFVILVPYSPWSDAHLYDQRGWYLAQGFGYVSEPGVPTAYTPPGYPLALSGVYLVFGHSVLAARMLNVILDSVTSVLIYWFAVELYASSAAPFSYRAPFLSGLLYAINPITIYMTGVTMTEVLFISLLMGMALAAIRLSRLFEEPNTEVSLAKNIIPYGLLGVLGGLAALTRTVIVSIFVFLVYKSTDGWRPNSRVRLLIVVGGAFFLTISPWILRNWLVSGNVTFDTHSGIMFYSGTVYMGPFFVDGAIDQPFEGLSEWEYGSAGINELADFVRARPFTYLWYSMLRTGHMLDINIESFILAFSSMIYGGHYNAVSSYLRDHPIVVPMLLLPIAQSVLWIGGGLVGLYSRFNMPRRHLILTVVLLWLGSHAILTGFPRYLIPMLPLLTITLSHFLIYFREGKTRAPGSMTKKSKGSVDILSNVIITLLLVAALRSWITTGMELVHRMQ